MEAKISVLLADASGDLRLLLRETLESTGEFQVVGETGDGGQVLALVEETHPQLLLLDGMGVLRQLREREEQPRTIVTSAFYNDRMVAEAVSLGAYIFLPKPVNEESACVKIGHIFFCFSRIIGFSPTVISYFFSKAYHPACLATAFMISSVKSS